jgi:heterotetrameric sarcosine oxidase gamma subunit
MAELHSQGVLRQSGLDGDPHCEAGLRMEEITGLRLSTLRCTSGTATPTGWPLTVGQVAGDAPALLCLRPGEWLLVGGDDDRHRAVAGQLSLPPIDRSQGLAVIRLRGTIVPWVLAKLSALDFHGGLADGTAHCAQTRMAGLRVIVYCHGVVAGQPAVIDLLVERSLARHLWERLLDSTAHAHELASQFAQACSAGGE